MRIWSIHPKHLDQKGLVALWRETLLAKHVLEGKTKGYKNHPQLNRFKVQKEPLSFINKYLEEVYNEASLRGYHFNYSKFKNVLLNEKILLTTGQIKHEKKHLLKKLKVRDLYRYRKEMNREISHHPIFELVEGKIEDWEVL